MNKYNLKILLFVSLGFFCFGCDTNSPEEVEVDFIMSYLQSETKAEKHGLSDSVKITVTLSFNYQFKNCYGTTEIFGMSLPLNMSYGGAIDGVLLDNTPINQIFVWDDSVTFFTTKKVPDNFTLNVSMSGGLYKSKSGKHVLIKNYSKSLSKEEGIVKFY